MTAATLRITEIFFSLQGETRTVGCPTVFIRLTGCPLRCHYCDTAYAFQGGQTLALSEILDTVGRYRTRYVTVTGGEPLAQPTVLPLLRDLCDRGYIVSLETSGALSVKEVDSRVVKILDIKTPGSGEMDKNLWQNLDHLSTQDQIKCVICDQQDYEWAKEIVLTRGLADRCEVLFSPSYGQLSNLALAEWILADQLPVRFQLQLHKQIWGEMPGK